MDSPSKATDDIRKIIEIPRPQWTTRQLGNRSLASLVRERDIMVFHDSPASVR